ncbi:hypothetical protein CHLRE_13g585050v5 [Chlamydomonas reinhardtii]|uniref:Methanethiol oxidase n=1 Tax=Chlamydomonas reinhardtii TaxID=3055 RepID=A8HUD7_CHLRE|nr:uncharacterized protein CHLRE_13g585050v5 [Chlamydomonas reinhardtii]XP_042917625.1 uncharacterized protein CHLRE_13g585050v5 [Chlamydomonas reinhardtii]PNW74095.1 hypothetical protein CHLRE_13g585050v5 [Chlamydomonas reinhardtii]PNW74096.1 hypothetical protein CHLRE_13g585050v5 [Chlamydomonas reinhardtii]|eukprot:XP_001693848.1 predicted protein [Chlamydomonas reinhardtii]
MKQRHASVLACILCCCALAHGALTARRSLLGSGKNKNKTDTSATYVYAWAGPKNASLGGKDSIFVISLADGEYGKIVSVVPTPYSTLEPHHCRISSTRKYMGCSGLFAAFSGIPGALFFELSDPRTPKLVDPAKVDQPKHSAFADEFVATEDGGFLLTMMGTPTGGSPGRVAHYDKDLKLIGEYPDPVKFPQVEGLNPHGLGVSWVHKTMLTVDFFEPASSMAGRTLKLRSTVRLWNISDWTISETIDASMIKNVSGPMDAVAIAETGAYFFGGGNGYVYYLDGKGPKPHVPVVAWDGLDGNPNRTSFGCIMHPFRNGTRLLAAMFVRDQVQLLDTTNPQKLKLLDTLQLPKGAGGHAVRVSRDEKMGAVATYYLEQGARGQLHHEGDLTIRLFGLNDRATKFILRQPAKSLIDFKTVAKKQGPFRPHGIAIY